MFEGLGWTATMSNMGAVELDCGHRCYEVAGNAIGFTYGVFGQSDSVQGVGVLEKAGKAGAKPSVAQAAS